MSRNLSVGRFTQLHPLDPQDATVTSAIRARAAAGKGVPPAVEGRGSFDALMESVEPRNDVRFEHAGVGGIPGLWVHTAKASSEAAILYTDS